MYSKESALTSQELAYYSRQIVLNEIGFSGQLKLKKSKILIAGVGGLGCQLAMQLATMGIGHLRLVDQDIVEVSNLQRQHLYSFDMLNYPKVEAAAIRLGMMNPNIKLEPIPASVSDWNAGVLLEGVDLVVDGLDRLEPRLAINRACVERGIPYIYGSAITHFGNVSTIIPGETPCLNCWQGDVDEESIPTCATVGVTPSIISIIASIQVSEAIRIILGEKPNLANKLLIFDLDDLSVETINLAKVKGCTICGETPRKRPRFSSIKEVCGRDGMRVFTFNQRSLLNLNIDDIVVKLRKVGLEVDLQTRLGVNFSRNGLRGSIFTTGVVVIDGAKSREEAQGMYRDATGLDPEGY